MKSNFFYLDNTDADPVEFDFCKIGSGPAAMSLRLADHLKNIFEKQL